MAILMLEAPSHLHTRSVEELDTESQVKPAASPVDTAVAEPAHTCPSDADIQARITQVLASLAQIDAQHVQVSVHKNVVTLHGHVRCWSERQLVEQVAWAAPAVTGVHNHLGLPY